jgi:hypothetical protein
MPRLRPTPWSRALVVATFAVAVILHALWDSATTGLAPAPVALISFTLLSRRLDAATVARS